MATSPAGVDELPTTVATPVVYLPDLTLERLLAAGVEIRTHQGSDLGPMHVATLTVPRTRDTIAVLEHYRQGPAPGYLVSMWGTVPGRRQVTQWLSSLLPGPLHLVWLDPDGTTHDEQWLPRSHQAASQTRSPDRRRTTNAPPARAQRHAASESGGRNSKVRVATPEEIRAWARANGFTVSDRGRIPSEVHNAFRAVQARPGRRAAVS